MIELQTNINSRLPFKMFLGNLVQLHFWSFRSAEKMCIVEKCCYLFVYASCVVFMLTYTQKGTGIHTAHGF